MTVTFLHTADIHLGKTYRTAADEAERYEDFFRMLGSIVSDAIPHSVVFGLPRCDQWTPPLEGSYSPAQLDGSGV